MIEDFHEEKKNEKNNDGWRKVGVKEGNEEER